jgi:hypothetical protein
MRFQRAMTAVAGHQFLIADNALCIGKTFKVEYRHEMNGLQKYLENFIIVVQQTTLKDW